MYKFLLIIAIGFLACTVNAQVSENVVTWDYPVNPSTPGWFDLSFEEKILAYNIPDEILKKISTAELVKVCFAYPDWGIIHAYNDRITGLSNLMRQFNGFYELVDRKDAAKELIKYYAGMDPLSIGKDWTDVQKGFYCFHIYHIELLLSVRRIIDQLDDRDRQVLLDEVALKYNQKKQRPDVYGVWELSPVAGLCLNIIDRDGENSKNDTKLLSLKRNFVTDDMKVLDSVFELANKLR
jgi:hypothetical protein